MNRSRFYFIVQSLLGKKKEKKQKLTSQREKLPSAILFCVYSCLVLCPRVFSVLFSIGITLLWKEIAGICTSLHLFVYFAHVKSCHLSLPFDVRGWLRLVPTTTSGKSCCGIFVIVLNIWKSYPLKKPIEVKTWGKQNEMHIHYIKTSSMVLGSRHKLRDLPRLNLNTDGHDITNVSQQKLLGLFIDDKLMWSAKSLICYFNNLCSALSSKIFLLRRQATYVSTGSTRVISCLLSTMGP